MKYVVIFLTLLSTSCNLFQRQQSAGESVAVEEKQQQEEVFVPVEKELYVIDKEEREDYYLCYNNSRQKYFLEIIKKIKE